MHCRNIGLFIVFAVWGLPGMAAEALDSVTLQLKWKHQFQFAGYYAALEKGFYRAAGLDVHIVEGGPERPPVETVVAGTADFGVSNSQLLLARANGAQVVALAPIIQHSPLSLLVLRDSGIRTVNDLAGKRLMIGPDDAELMAYFVQSGLHPHDYVRQTHSQNVNDLIDGRTDGLTAYTPDQPYSLYQAGLDYLELRAINGNIDFYGDTLFTTEQYIQDHPAQAKAFRAATLKGWAYAMLHPEEIAELIHLRYTPERSVEQLIWEATHYRPFVMADMIELGHNSLSRWQHIAEVYGRLGMLPANFDLTGFVYDAGERDTARWYPWLAAAAGLLTVLAGFAFFALRSRQALFHLHASHEKMAANLPGVIYQFLLRADGSSCFPYASAGINDIFGLKPEQVKADAGPVFDLVSPDDLERVKQRISESAERQVEWFDEFRITHPQKGEIWLEGRASPSRLENGDVLWYGFITDISEQRRLLKQLQASESRFRQLFEFTPVAYQSLDINGCFLDLNDRLADLLGYRRETLLGRCFCELLDESEKHMFPLIFDAFKAANNMANELRLRHSDGSIVTVLIDGRIQRDADGRFLRTHCILHNISERKTIELALQKSEARFRNIAATVPGMLCDYVFSPPERRGFLYVGPRCVDILGLEAQTLSADAQYFLRMVYPDDMPLLQAEERAAAEERRYFNAEFRVVSASGQLKWLQWVAQPNVAEPGEPVVWTGIMLDITERKQAEEKLARAKEAAEAASKAKSLFLSSMSHELRTPLNAVIGFGQLLETDEEEPLTEGQREAVEMMLRGGRHLLRLVNEILDLVRVESGKIELSYQPVALAPAFQHVHALLANMAAAREVALKVCPDCSEATSKEKGFCLLSGAKVWADPDKFRQILLNLVSNAIKYNRPGGRVDLSCQVFADCVRISVKDTGRGIAEQHQLDVFQPFQRFGVESSAIEGTGIGLVICKQLVEAMGGRIGFESQEAVGSTFWIELPSASADEAIETDVLAGNWFSLSPADAALTGQVVYVEDNESNISVMRHVFRRLPGLTLSVATSAEQGLPLIRNLLPDLVLMDINLPGISGVEALRELLADPATADIPVIAVSADAMGENVSQNLQAGFKYYLTKPFSIEQLREVIYEHLPR